MEKMKKKVKNENEDIKRIQENCELISKYFFEMDKKLLGKSADKRIISPFDDLVDYIYSEVELYYKYITGEDGKNFDRLVIMLVEFFLYQIALNRFYPQEDIMIFIINQIGMNYNYDSNRFLAEVFAYYFINEEYSKLFEAINNKLGAIIFSQEEIFIAYFLTMFQVNDNLIEKKHQESQFDILLFMRERNYFFKIPEQSLTSLNSLYKYLSVCAKIELKHAKNKMVESKDSDENTQETDRKINIRNLGEIQNKINNNNKEKKDDPIYKISELEQKIKEMKIISDRRYHDLKEENSKLNIMNFEISQNIISLKTKVKNLEEKLFKIQSRDLWKQIVNYNLYHLNIQKTGDYDERIGKIISELKKFKNSQIYIKFFEDVNAIINKGNLTAHDFEKKLPIGMKVNYIDVLFKNQRLPNISSAEIKFVKKILMSIKTEVILERFVQDKNALYENMERMDLRKVISDAITKK